MATYPAYPFMESKECRNCMLTKKACIGINADYVFCANCNVPLLFPDDARALLMTVVKRSENRKGGIRT